MFKKSLEFAFNKKKVIHEWFDFGCSFSNAITNNEKNKEKKKKRNLFSQMMFLSTTVLSEVTTSF